MHRKKLILAGILLLVIITGYGQGSLVGHWNFDNIRGDTIFDQSGFNNHGMNQGAEVVEGIHGSALHFNGEDAFAEITGDGNTPPEILSELGKGSISIWFKVEHIPTEYGIAPLFYYGMKGKCDFFDAANKGLILELGHSPIFPGNEHLFFTIWKNGCTYPSFCYDTGFPVSENEWHHFVAVVGEDYNTGYLDGKELDNRRYNFGNSSYSQFFADVLAHEKLWLGKGHWDRTTQYFKGIIDELRIYSKPLSDQEVKALYEGTPTTAENRTELNPDQFIEIYPNPVKNKIYFDFSQLKDEIRKVKIIDMTGKTIHNQQIKNSNSMDVKTINPGVYMLMLTGQKGNYQKKILIQH
jgi:hypothetical protein